MVELYIAAGLRDGFAWFGGAIVVLSAIGVGVALIKGSYNKARIEALRGDNEDLRNKIEDLRTEVNDLEHQHERDVLEKQALSERVSHVENQNDLLTQLVTQRADVEALNETLTAHHTAAMKGLSTLTQKTDTILSEVRKKTA